MNFGYGAVWFTLVACNSTRVRPVARVIESVSVLAPPIPKVCTGSRSKLHVHPQNSQHMLLLFTSDWCTACDRVLEQLADASTELDKRNVSVLNSLTEKLQNVDGVTKINRTYKHL